jgi:hypothetical protein
VLDEPDGLSHVRDGWTAGRSARTAVGVSSRVGLAMASGAAGLPSAAMRDLLSVVLMGLTAVSALRPPSAGPLATVIGRAYCGLTTSGALRPVRPPKTKPPERGAFCRQR